MSGSAIRDAVAFDFASIVAINSAEVQQTSPMDRERLDFLDRMSSYHKVAIVDGQVVAFLLAMGAGATYANDNYAWFATRYADFVYIDRIVVRASVAGRGIGRALYLDLFEFARSQGIATVTCEYNIDPPNPASRAFHARHGFREVGTQWVADRSKQVSLQVAEC